MNHSKCSGKPRRACRGALSPSPPRVALNLPASGSCVLVILVVAESRPSGGNIPAEIPVLNGTAGDNGTAGGPSTQPVLGRMKPPLGGISSGNIRVGPCVPPTCCERPFSTLNRVPLPAARASAVVHPNAKDAKLKDATLRPSKLKLQTAQQGTSPGALGKFGITATARGTRRSFMNFDGTLPSKAQAPSHPA